MISNAIDKQRGMTGSGCHNATPVKTLVWMTDTNDVIIYLSRSIAHLFELGNVLSVTMYARFIHPDDQARVIAIFSKAKESYEECQTDYRVLAPDGTIRWVTGSGAPRFADDGEFLGYAGALIDVTEHYEALEQLAKSEASHRLLTENSLDLISHHAPDSGIYRYASPSFQRVLGYAPADLVGRTSIYAQMHPDDMHLIHEEIQRQADAAGDSRLIEFRVRHKDGRMVWMGTSVKLLLNPVTDEKTGLVAVSRDISKEVEIAEKLAHLAEENKALLENSLDIIALLDREGRFLRLNAASFPILGYQPEELLGRPYADLLDAGEALKVRAVDAGLRTGQNTIQDFESRWRRKDGRIIHLSLALRWSDHKQLMYATARDVTERYRAQDELRKSKDRVDAILESIGDAFFALDRDWRVTYANRKACAFVGAARESAIGALLTELAPHMASWVSMPHYQRAMEKRENVFFESYWEPSGSWVEVRIYPNEDGISVYFHDITAKREAEHALRKSEKRFRNLFDQAGDSIIIADSALRIHDVNERACEALGYRRDQLLLLTMPDVAAGFNPEPTFWRDLRAGQTRLMQSMVRNAGGIAFPAEVHVSRFEEDGEEFFQAIARDLTERVEAQKKISDSERRFREVIEMTPAGYLLADSRGKIIDLNPALCHIAGYSREELVGAGLPELFFHCPWEGVAFAINGPTSTHGMEAVIRHKDGRQVYVLFNGSIKRDSEGRAQLLTGLLTDITARKEAESRLERLATHDTLTSLPNRTLLNERVQQMLDNGPRNTPIAIMFIDLDRFKEVNDSFGHESGDVLLREVARRLRLMLRPTDVIARLGGDEFVVAAYCSAGERSAASIAEKLLGALATPVDIGQQEVVIGASIGISMYPDDAGTKELLFQSADTAMYRAKASGRNGYCFFEAEMTVEAKTRMMLELSLRHALTRQEFALHYQPRIDLRAMSIVGMEALIRWNHPELGRVSPLQFIPIAEDTGRIESIGLWVLEEACVQTRRLMEKFGRPLCVSVNLSARQLKCRVIVDQVRATLNKTGLPPSLLELELTESALIENIEHSAKLLKELKALGIRLAVDDFGTGYSGLAYLRRFPLDVLKLDRSFVLQQDDDDHNFDFIKAFVDMAHALKLSVVAEGVETSETLQFLRNAACDEAQGYFLARPLALGEFEDYLSRLPGHVRTIGAA
jgi:diguanylate cyclase (GGDEF)-like protein/PAS domain S-box-containing protein